MIGEYSWFCPRSFLVDSRLQRCSGPETLGKCFACETRDHPLKRRVLQRVLKTAAVVGALHWPRVRRLAPYRVWADLQESKAYLDLLRAKVARFVIGDRQAQSFFLGHGVPEEKVAYIERCLPDDALQWRSRMPRTAGVSVGRPLTLAFVGRLGVEKGFHVLARAFEELPENARAELWVIHVHDAIPEKAQPMFRNQKRFRKHLDDGTIRLFRPSSKDELYSLMASADVGIVPSIAYESPSLAMMEFAAQGTPVIRSESAGMEHVIQDGVNGRTFPYGSPDELRKILLEVIERPQTLAEWRSRLPKIGDDSSFAARLVDVFGSVIEENKGSRREDA
ncbi:MAG: glycosyltransferase [Pseudomonadota bacterium]|nr:glycosyltransferase [Pseudomonadota bacterium]